MTVDAWATATWVVRMMTVVTIAGVRPLGWSRTAGRVGEQRRIAYSAVEGLYEPVSETNVATGVAWMLTILKHVRRRASNGAKGSRLFAYPMAALRLAVPNVGGALGGIVQIIATK